MALSSDRATPERKGWRVNVGLAADSVIYQGALVARDDDGYLVPADEDNTLRVLGRAAAFVDNTGGVDGAVSCEVDIGIFRWDNSAGADEIEISHIGNIVFAIDDEAVALTSDTGARPVAGRVFDVEAAGVWIDHDWAEQASTLDNDSVDSQHYAAGSIDNEHLAANSVDSVNYVDGSIDGEHYGAGARTVAPGGAVALAAADALGLVLFSTTGAGDVTITRSTLTVGKLVTLCMTAFTTGIYELVCAEGTLTFNAADECATVFWDGTDMRVASLNGATVL